MRWKRVGVGWGVGAGLERQVFNEKGSHNGESNRRNAYHISHIIPTVFCSCFHRDMGDSRIKQRWVNRSKKGTFITLIKASLFLYGLACGFNKDVLCFFFLPRHSVEQKDR